MAMKTVVLLSLSLTAALALPPFPPGEAQSPVLTKEEQRPVQGDWVPQQGHVEVEHPGPQARLGPRDQQEQMDPEPLDMEQIQRQGLVELEVRVKPEVKVEQELKAEAEVKPEVNVDQELKAESDIKVEPEIHVETEPGEKEEFPVLMNLEPEREIGQEVQERHIDMERTYEIARTIMELEPQNNDIRQDKVSKTELSDVEKSLIATFQDEGPGVESPPEEKSLMKEMGNEPVLKLEPILNDELVPETAAMDEGPALDFMGNPIVPLEEYYPKETGLSKQQDALTVEGMETGSQESQVADRPVFRKTALEDQPVYNGDDQIATRRSYCRGVVLEGKCYQFFKGPKKAVDAEFFCQETFPGGHLASITSQHIHREVMNMMQQQNGKYTRTWIGGLRYLETGRFIWLDGSQWVYEDWLTGEPNNTADLEDCVEVLAYGSGKFNDFTCWEPQAFICSFQYP